MIDTHTHLYVDAFDQDRDQAVNRAIAAGVERFYIPAIDSGHVRAMEELKATWPDRVYLMAGLHPTSVKEDYKEELDSVKAQLDTGAYCAVGETGIDLHWDTSTLAWQQDAFRRQIRWAKQYGLPLVIHCRKAFDEIFDLLEAERDERLFGIFHCFTGTYEQAQHAIALGMKLGIGGVVTFKNGQIDRFLNRIPIEHIVLETDSPYLAPVPHRGKRNESSYLPLIAEKVAGIYGMSVAEVAQATTENARQIFDQQ